MKRPASCEERQLEVGGHEELPNVKPKEREYDFLECIWEHRVRMSRKSLWAFRT